MMSVGMNSSYGIWRHFPAHLTLLPQRLQLQGHPASHPHQAVAPGGMPERRQGELVPRLQPQEPPRMLEFRVVMARITFDENQPYPRLVLLRSGSRQPGGLKRRGSRSSQVAGAVAGHQFSPPVFAVDVGTGHRGQAFEQVLALPVHRLLSSHPVPPGGPQRLFRGAPRVRRADQASGDGRGWTGAPGAGQLQQQKT
jgi:hypothetical protein